MDTQKFQNWLQKGCSGALEGWGCFGYHQEAAEDVGVDPEEDFGRCQEQPHLANPPRKPVSGRPRKISQETMKLMKKKTKYQTDCKKKK